MLHVITFKPWCGIINVYISTDMSANLSTPLAAIKLTTPPYRTDWTNISVLSLLIKWAKWSKSCTLWLLRCNFAYVFFIHALYQNFSHVKTLHSHQRTRYWKILRITWRLPTCSAGPHESQKVQELHLFWKLWLKARKLWRDRIFIFFLTSYFFYTFQWFHRVTIFQGRRKRASLRYIPFSIFAINQDFFTYCFKSKYNLCYIFKSIQSRQRGIFFKLQD